jgi:PEGA domain
MANSNPENRLVRRLLVAACLAACLNTTGCVRRRLTVRTFPAGAQVFVDNQEIGTTPCSASFLYYGTREIKVVKDGYRTETLFQKIYPPWYQIPPLDFVTENVVPNEIRDERIVDVQLVPEEIVPQQRLLDNAQALRDGARAGYVTPLLGNGGAAASRHEPPIGVPGQGLPGGQPLPYEPLPQPSASP